LRIFAIGDLHLSDGDKPMDVFGEIWTDHFARIAQDLRARAAAEDVILLPGDFSWAMRLEDATRHLALLATFPGNKILVRGNHDYWWSSIQRVREALPPNCFALQNDALRIGDVVFAGTRGWLLPYESTAEDDRKIYRREVLRLELSLKAARRISEELPLVVMMHYPPLTREHRQTDFTRLLTQYRAHTLVYGHLHGQALHSAFHGETDGVQYVNVSADGIGFTALEIPLEC
jgi:predicted phosphohydrolase